MNGSLETGETTDNRIITGVRPVLIGDITSGYSPNHDLHDGSGVCIVPARLTITSTQASTLATSPSEIWYEVSTNARRQFQFRCR
ncbi:hypothetical protein JYT83_01230, partial [bacterium AH-315-F18]|nr:hypothetical protein [bacterium AH-315-F18]